MSLSRRAAAPALAVRIRLTRKGRYGALNLASFRAHIDRAQLHAERRRYGLDGSPLAATGRIGGVPKHGRPLHAGRDLLEQFQPFRTDPILEGRESGRVAARPRQAVNEASAHWVGNL